MKEITRIHIAKVAYDIEVPAKKKLEAYTTALERYAEDQEILSDIEIRITELLAEQGIEKGGVITQDDVTAVRERLGEPSDFAAESTNDHAIHIEEVDNESRRIYRDTDSAVLGGVLAGIGRFFGVDPLWIRLVFIVVLFVSFGTALILYVILWLIIPPARSAAEKLRMTGKPVTLESIRQLGEQNQAGSEVAQIMQRVLRYGAGTVLLIGAVGSLVATLTIGGGLLLGSHDGLFIAGWQPLGIAAVALFILAGLLFTALLSVLASAILCRRWDSRIGVAVVTIIATGLLSFGVGITAIVYGYQEETRYIQASMKETKAELPREFASIKKLVASAHTVTSGNSQAYSELTVQYRVSTDTPRYVLTALPDVKPDIKIVDGQARVVLKSSAMQQAANGRVVPQLIIYGPALDEVNVEQGNLEYSANYPEGQNSLKLSTLAMTQVTLHGVFNTLDIQGAGQVDMSASTVSNLTARLEPGSAVQAGVVRTLKVTQPDVCPARAEQYDEQNRLTVQDVSSGVLTYNGKERAAKTIKHVCGAVIIGSGDEESQV